MSGLAAFREFDHDSYFVASGALNDILMTDAVCVSFGALPALSRVSLSIRRGELVGLIGPNGAGKTTLVNCLSGFQRPVSGEIHLGKNNVSGWSPQQFSRAGIARTFQAGRLFKNLTVLENVIVPLMAAGGRVRHAREAAMSTLAWLGLSSHIDRRAGTLPYTDERRVGIARALATTPSFVLLDEPAAGMSDAECEDISRCISDIPKMLGCGVLLIEHNMRVVMDICSRVHVLDGGRTLADGLPSEIQMNAAVMDAYLGGG